ncbi:MAG: septum formation initiator family protein [Desulfobacterales bacterium]|nr:septum formation initiator family protein [Desulfobacterales bacterium]
MLHIKQRFLISLAAIILTALFILTFYGEKGYNELISMYKQRDEISASNEALEQQNHHSYREVDRLKNDLKYIEKVARQELGMIGKNEVILKIKK